jgi:hypothetical protein
MSAGKGDKQRPTDKKKYNDNYDKIDWGKKDDRVLQHKNESLQGQKDFGAGPVENYSSQHNTALS